MDEKLHIVQHLYGEGDDPAVLQRLLEDDGLRADYEALHEAKRYLDGRPPTRPDPLVLERIVAAAASPRAGVLPGQRQDRAARPRRATRRYRLAGALSGVLALVLVVGIGLNQFFFQGLERAPAERPAGALMQDAPADAAAIAPHATTAETEEAKAVGRMSKNAAEEAEVFADEADALAPATPPTPEERLATTQPAAREVNRPARVDEALEARDTEAPAPLLGADAEAVAGARLERSAADLDDAAAPAWDEADDLMRVRRRLDIVRARSRPQIWDESAVMSLDSLPAQPTEALPGLNAAGKKKQ